MHRSSVGTPVSNSPARRGRRMGRFLSAAFAIVALSAATALQAAPMSVGKLHVGARPAGPAQVAAAGRSLYLPLIFGGAALPASVTVMAAGDIACGSGSTSACKQAATAELLVANNPDLVLPLGDNQYECGSLADFQGFYDPTWGVMKSRSRPTVGNHEYGTSSVPTDPCYDLPAGAAGYYTYFGSLASPTEPGCTANCKGYYSYDAGSWHVIVLNSTCIQVGGCGLGSAQEIWLRNDLAAHPTQCTLAYWHYPRFTSGLSTGVYVPSTTAFWQDLYNAGVDIVLNGHDHDYERFSPMDPNGNLDLAHGIRQFVVGTGGESHHGFSTILPNSEVRDNTSFGVLKLVLGNGSYSWQFLPTAGGAFTDSGSESCR